MLTRCARRGAAGGVALFVGLAGLTITQGAATASPPLPATQAGPVAIWGPADPVDGLPLPSISSGQASEAFVKVVADGTDSAIGLTADGRVEQFGDNIWAQIYPSAPIAVPASLAGETVVDIAGGGEGDGDGMAVTSSGEVVPWSLGTEGWVTTMPSTADLQGSTAAAISLDGHEAAVVKNGGVVVWGDKTTSPDEGQYAPPTGLTGAVSVFFSGNGTTVFALKSDGTLSAWGDDSAGLTDLPAATTDSTDALDVKDVASVNGSAVALLSDGSLVVWGTSTQSGAVNALPSGIAGKDIVALAASGLAYFAVDSDGNVYEWGNGPTPLAPEFEQLPDGVDPANITGLSVDGTYAIAIQAKYAYVTKPTISGTAKVGQTLTATPATFTAEPDSTTGQWLANGTPISGATGTTYTPTASNVGKTITYSETATRGTESATATSDPTAKVAASTGSGSTTTTPPPSHTATPVNQKLVNDQAKLKKDQAKLKKDKKALKKAHGAKKAKLKKAIKKLNKTIKKDKKAIKADE